MMNAAQTNYPYSIPPNPFDTKFKIWRRTDRGRMIIAEDEKTLYIHDWQRKKGQPYFNIQVENNQTNQFLYSNTNPHDNSIEAEFPKESFNSLKEIEDWNEGNRDQQDAAYRMKKKMQSSFEGDPFIGKKIYYRLKLNLYFFAIYGPWKLGFFQAYIESMQVITGLELTGLFSPRFQKCIAIKKQNGKLITIGTKNSDQYKFF